MEKLYRAQHVQFEELQRLRTNYNKDGESRKTQTYLKNKLEILESLWTEFSNTDEQMREQYFESEQSHQYWTERDSVKQLYINLRKDIEGKIRTVSTIENVTTTPAPLRSISLATSEIHTPRTSTQGSVTSLPTSEQSRRYKTQDVKMSLIYKQLEEATELLENVGSQEQIQRKLQQLDSRMAQIEQLHEDILVDATPEEEITSQYFKENYFENLITKYEYIRSKMKDVINNQKAINGQKSDIKLKRIEIPPFYGDSLKWASFYDLFTKLVHENDQISETIKMHQLKTTVLGNASKIISHFEATGANYQDAWKLLINRYQNKRQLASNHVNNILGFPAIYAESALAIKSLHDTLMESLYAIKNLGILTISWNYIIIPIVTKKLDNETLRLYEMSITDPREMPTIEEFLNFLERRFQALESTKTKTISRNTAGATPQVSKVKTYHAQTTTTCSMCNQGHGLKDCIKFKQLSTVQRAKFITDEKLCRLCMKQHRNLKRCPNLKTNHMKCSVCQGKHNTLLHTHSPLKQVSPQNRKAEKIQNNEISETDLSVTTHLASKDEQSAGTLLATALVKIQTGNQHPEFLRVLIDPGSQASFITEEATRKLNKPTKRTHVGVEGINESEITIATKLVKFRVEPRFSSNFFIEMEALVVPKVTKSLPDQGFDSRRWKHLNNLLWADPNYSQPNKIDILLGADYYSDILMNNVIKGNKAEPIAQETELGWIIFGNMSEGTQTNIHSMVTLTDIDNQLKRFWELEELQENAFMTEEERQCEEHYQRNHSRDSDGRYIVRLPFKQAGATIQPQLGSSKQRALARFIQLERRLSKPDEFSTSYRDCITEYLNQGHLIECSFINHDGYYIPHHAVVKPTSATTKLRVVFDASAKTNNNISLNQLQLVGPKLQEDLMSILLRWRKYKIAYTADIEKMYRQIKVHPDDQKYQKILWRESPDDAIKTYQLTTVTFGMASAPYLAVKTLHQLAIDEENNFPIAAKLIKNDFYVDDFLSGSHTIEDANKQQIQIINLLQTGGFNLRKWTSNCPQMLEHVKPERRAFEPITFDSKETIKTLGLIWNPVTDTFEFKVNLNNAHGKMTKRKMLSESSKLFDPLGWLSPTLIQAKILMQTLWISGVAWDQELSTDIEKKCQKYYTSLPILEGVKIPRWISFNLTILGELHGFCDASEVAYAAVVYFYDRSSNKATLLMAKTRVAPIANKLTLPKLELCGAVLLSRLMKRVQQDLQIDEIPKYFWTDSMIVLGWVKNTPHKFKTFVANRISEIQNLTAPSQWFHIKSSSNPADCASRGIEAGQLVTHSLWWNGPSAIFENASQLTPFIVEEVPDQLEVKQRILGATAVVEENVFDQLYKNHSNFRSIKRIVAYVKRFINKCRKLAVEESEHLSAKEVEQSTLILIQLAQKQHFKHEIHELTNGKEIPRQSCIKSISPFMQDGILRVGGRLQNSTVWSYNERHPIIIPKKHPIAILLVKEAHQHTMHGGTQLTLAHIRTKYWIIHARELTRRFIQRCIKCHRFNSKGVSQIMGNLPEARIVPGRPFLKTGVDYAGPLQIRTTKGRGHKSQKGYLSIFVCMATKAIHIEPVSDLTTEGFIAAYKRFTSRRGLCSDLYSDNGTNFVGANNQLKRELTTLLRGSTKEIAHLLANDGTTWHFIPPASPHFGGIWEAAVKSVKTHLIKVIGEATLTFEELTTVTAQVEACLNSRPLTPVTTDPTDITFLTPGHFLIGAPLQSIPQDTVLNVNISGLSRWKMVEKIKQDFWKRWQSEYLTQLQHRRKWSSVQPNLKEGELVLIKDDNTPPLKWVTGRIIEVHEGKDKKVRVVSLRGPGGLILKRPIHKLAPLPIEPENLHEWTKLPITTHQPLQPLSKVQTHHVRTKTVQRYPLLKLILFILGIAQMLVTPASTLSNIEPLSSDARIYFHNTGTVNLMALRWKIIINYDLSGYWDDIRAVEQHISHLNETCQGKEKADHNIRLCEIMIQQLTDHWQEIKSQNALITTTNRDHLIKKRDIGDTVGYILGDAFGIMTQRDAFHIETQLDRIKTNEAYLLELIKNQTSIIDATANLFKHDRVLNEQQFSIIAKHFLSLDGKIAQLSADSTQTNKVQSMTTFTIYIMQIMRRLAEKQRVIIDVILDSHKGHIHPALLTPQQLKAEIQRIEDYIPATMTVPDADDDHSLGHIYEILTVQTRVTARNILFRVQLPLTYTEVYQLFHIIPIPQTDGDRLRIIVPSTEHLIINLRREHYAPLTNRQLQRCVQLKNNLHICDISPIYNTNSKQSQCEVTLLNHVNQYHDSCTTAILNESSYWTRLDTNRWIFAVTQPTIVDLICNQQISTLQLHNSGILRLDPNCILKNGQFYLTAIEEKSHIITSSIVASMMVDFKTEYLPQQQTARVPTDHFNYTSDTNLTREISEVENAIAVQKLNEATLPTLIDSSSEGHHVHHYVGIYTIITIGVMITAVYICRRKRNAPPTTENICVHERPIPRPRSFTVPAPQYVQSPI